MIARFTNAEAWHAAITAAVIAGLQFDACDNGRTCGTYTITYTGGY